jgi:hypothetical protein
VVDVKVRIALDCDNEDKRGRDGVVYVFERAEEYAGNGVCVFIAAWTALGRAFMACDRGTGML